MPSFSIRSSEGGDHLSLHISDAPVIGGSRYEDWAQVEVEVKAGGFRAKFGAEFLLYDIKRLHDELVALQENLAGTLKFQTLEGQLEFVIIGDGKGHFQVNGTAIDSLGSANKLYFEIPQFDQTFIPQMLQELSIMNQQLLK